ncbi:hypothetical protein BDP55DRAFT_659245 [Colletotrichum godetiae]|uniref:Transposase n=1 Tax=Colletotrichum godetiae TaxID=1209918 RepID=A0AAJ0AP01_9PEZI|nr:uncharacterized protein BDP55DRAFT_659245 [Colletotrichum godetiae]KAK1687723.1 hypothetical protein BDP55DRAFT_659245 [Colletotrichum godetiae]
MFYSLSSLEFICLLTLLYPRGLAKLSHHGNVSSNHVRAMVWQYGVRHVQTRRPPLRVIKFTGWQRYSAVLNILTVMHISPTWIEDLSMQVIRRAYLQSHGESVRSIRHAFQG